MKNKGLCSTCINDKECDFLRNFPVNRCDEFEGYEKPEASQEKSFKK